MDFVCLIQSRSKGGQVTIRQVRGIKQGGLRPFGMKSRERKPCPFPSSMRNQARETSLIWYDVARKECMSSFIRYEESSRCDFVCPERSRALGGLVLVCLVRGIKLAGLRPFGTKSRDWRACPRPSCRINQANGTSSVQYEVA